MAGQVHTEYTKDLEAWVQLADLLVEDTKQGQKPAASFMAGGWGRVSLENHEGDEDKEE